MSGTARINQPLGNQRDCARWRLGRIRRIIIIRMGTLAMDAKDTLGLLGLETWTAVLAWNFGGLVILVAGLVVSCSVLDLVVATFAVLD